MKSTIDLSAIAAFVAVLRAGSFTAAANLLQTDKATLSRIITRLEDEMGCQLLLRTTRSLAATEAGERLLHSGGSILDSAETLIETVRGENSNPQGKLRITAGEEFGQLVVSRWITRFLNDWPKTNIEAVFTNRVTDLIEEGFDLGVRVGQLPDSTLRSRKIGEVHYSLYASKGLLQKFRDIRTVDDLEKAPWVAFTPAGQKFIKLSQNGAEVEIAAAVRLTCNNNLVARQAILSGVGIGLLPDFQVNEQVALGALIKICPEISRTPSPVHIVFPGQKFLPQKQRLFVETADRFVRQNGW